MKTTNLLIAVLCLMGLTAPAVAQEFFKLPAAARAIIKKTPTRTPGPKSFSFPKKFHYTKGPKNLAQLNEALQRNIAQVEAANVGTDQLPPIPWHESLWQAIPEKIFLDIASQEERFYQQEIALMTNLHNQIGMVRNFRQQQADVPDDLLIDITNRFAHIKDNYLRNMSLNLWEEGNLEALQMELAQYYSLGTEFEDAAFNYSLRHPYKRNLQTMRLLHFPFIDKKFKEPVEAFVNQPFISLADKEAFKQALRNLQAEYNRIRQNAVKTPGMQVTIRYYQQTINELSNFIKRYKRRPKGNTSNAAEKELNFRIEYLFYCETQYNYEPFAKYHKQLRGLWEKYTPQYWTQEQTLEAFEKFLQTAPKDVYYPRSLIDEPNISRAEELLYDNLLYWRTSPKGDVLAGSIRDLQAKYR